MREPGRADQPRVALRRAPVLVHDRGRRPLTPRDVRRGLGRQVLRVDRDFPAALLQEARAGQSHRAAAEDRESFLARRPRFVDGQLRGAPGERDAAAAVAVVVHDRLVADLLRADLEARSPVGAQADDGPDDPVLGDVSRRGGSGQTREPARRPAHAETPAPRTARPAVLSIARRPTPLPVMRTSAPSAGRPSPARGSCPGPSPAGPRIRPSPARACSRDRSPRPRATRSRAPGGGPR